MARWSASSYYYNSLLLLRVYVLIGSEVLEGGVALPLAQLEM